MPHTNRSKKTLSSGRAPTAAEVARAREASGLSQPKAAKLIHVSTNGWQNWEQDLRGMPPSAFEFFLLRSGQYVVDSLQMPTGPGAEDALPMLRLRTDDGRQIDLQIRPEELARLSRIVAPHFASPKSERRDTP